MSNVPYSSVVGSLMYAMVCTRPDLSHAVSVVSRYMHNPGKDHWKAVKWILRYVKGTIGKGLVFDKKKLLHPMLQALLILIMVVIWTGGGPYLGISLPCAQVLSLGKHRCSILQPYLLQKLNTLLLLKG